MVLGIQVIGALFGLFFMYLAFLNFKRKEFNLGEWVLWSAVAAGFLLLSLFPQILDPVTRQLNISRKMDLIIILGFMLLIAGLFYTYTTAMKSKKKIEEVVRKMAIEEAERKK